MPTQTFDPRVFKEAQRAGWGAAAAGWERWHEILEGETAGQRQTDLLLELAGIGPRDHVLDVATGIGEPGLSAARAVRPGGRVVCTDIAEEMLAVARRRAREQQLDNVDLVPGDAETLAFDDGTFDAIICRHGLQFLVDVAGTLGRFRRFLAADGRFAAIVWGPPSTVGFARALPVILEELRLPPPPADQPGIFALADAERLAALAASAGFRDVETGTVEVVYEAPDPTTWTRLVRDISPPIAAMVDRQRPDVQERVWEKVTAAWAPFAGTDGVTRVDCQAIWVAGTR